MNQGLTTIVFGKRCKTAMRMNDINEGGSRDIALQESITQDDNDELVYNTL